MAQARDLARQIWRDFVCISVCTLEAGGDPIAAGMTDVAVTLWVTDTATGEQKLYLSPLGSLFQPILDLGAFATCGG